MSTEIKKNDRNDQPETPIGSKGPIPNDPDRARQMAIAEDIMQDDSELLRTLAKRKHQT